MGKKYSIGMTLFFAMVLSLSVTANARNPYVRGTFITGAPPTIDGVVNPGEWPGAPQIVIDQNTPNPNNYNYVIPTYVYILNDLSSLYVLVDSIGDT
jgi:hypothetical protein